MTPHDLIAAFDAVAEAPDGVEWLRELVLQLAVRGKLVPQDPSDEPASVLLTRIAAEKARLVRKGTIRAPTPLPVVSAEAALFDAPQGWAWCRFQDLHLKLGAGSTPLGGKKTYIDDGVIFIRSQNVWNEGLRLGDAARISASTHARMAETAVLADDVLLNITGASIGRSAIVPADVGAANVSQHVAILRQVEPETRWWVHLFVISPIGDECIMGAQVGISREGLSMNRLREFPIPVPPLAEQRRIMARVDELMDLLDRLESARTARDATRASTRDSVLDALREADTRGEVDVAWNRFAERMDDLLCEPTDIAPLRQAVLQLAVRGRLVAQDPSDEPASVLLTRIAAEKARLVRKGTIRAPTPLPVVSAEAALFDAPQGWAWCRFQDLHLKLGAGSTPLGGKKTYIDDGVIFIRSQNVWNEGLRLGDAARISASTHARMAETAVLADDVLLNITGASIGRSAIVPADVGAANVSQHVAILRQVEPETRWWVHLFVISPIGDECIMGAQVGISREGLSMNRLREFPIPVPPLAEQRRIMARVDELMDLLDRLRDRLAAARNRHTAFAAAAVHHLDP